MYQSQCERVQNQKGWKRRVGYGRRWLVEIVFSTLKRMFGGSVNAVRMENIVQEIAIRINTYNRLLAALFSLGDLASLLFESELRSVILFGSDPVAGPFSYSRRPRSPILNRALLAVAREAIAGA